MLLVQKLLKDLVAQPLSDVVSIKGILLMKGKTRLKQQQR